VKDSVQNTTPNAVDWHDVSLTGGDLFDTACEYRFRHTLPNTWPKPGEYWTYANMVSPTNIIFQALA
jgi:hypothetical protein